MLTDGCVSDSQRVIDLIRTNCTPSPANEDPKNLKVYALGIGEGVDEALVNNSAAAGRGKSYFAKDSNPGHLNSLVIEALQDATVPYLKNCDFKVSMDSVNEN